MSTGQYKLRRQRGAVLVIGLIVLLMLTLLGISNMNMTSVELKITSNTQNRNHAFQGSASLIEQVMQAPSGGAFRINFTSTAVQPLTEQSAAGVKTGGEVAFTGSAQGIACPGGQGLRVSCNFYEIRSAGTHVASGAISNQVQGLYRPGILTE